MNPGVISFIQRYVQLDPSEETFIASTFSQKTAPKGHHLLLASETCTEFIILLKGNTRVYLIDDEGKEITVWFGLPGIIGSDIQSFISGLPSKFYIQAMEEIEYASISKHDFSKISVTVPRWETLQAKIWGEAVVQIIDRVIAFQYQSAEERYKTLQQNTAYAQGIPQKHLASFLGITHTSLSRLRRKKNAQKH